MALERIDPIRMEDCYAVDHLLRYAFAGNMAEGKRVLDAACGLGFGSIMMMHKGAREVIGIDNSKTTIDCCRERWELDNLSFKQADLHSLEDLQIGEFDLITSFETLEHVEHPDRVLWQFKRLLGENGVLLGSIPGRNDLNEDNEFHLHHFTAEKLQELLSACFENVQVFRQDFSVKSSFSTMGASPPGEPLRLIEQSCLEIDFGQVSAKEDTLVFFASGAELCSLDLSLAASSRNAWQVSRSSYLEAIRRLGSFSSKYADIFHKHGDLKVKFAKMLGWGRWHYEQLNGEPATDTVLERIERINANREEEMKSKIGQLQKEIQILKKQKSELEQMLHNQDKDQCRRFTNQKPPA